MNRYKLNNWIGALACALVVASCSIKYSFSGASISPESKTFSVQFFPNMAPLVNPVLSSTFTEALKMKFLTGTRLSETDDAGDLAFEGEITGYAVTPQAITAGEVAAQNRLTISVHVKFTNEQDPAQSYDKSFSQYEDYDSQRNLSDVEGELMEAIVKKLVEDIFNAAVANW
ncbi:MAG: LPS assembly lipoprotein LptE [Prevotellaceae bacterium]|nr:LPS assembly lipoprotein LptE [Prevotellaceae bacterium]